MAPFLVILSLLLMGVAIVAWHTRATWWHMVAHFLPQPPLTRAAKAARATAAPALQTPHEPLLTAEPDAFVCAPDSRSFMAEAPVVPPAAAPAHPANDPFAHAPSLSDLSEPGGFPQAETRH